MSENQSSVKHISVSELQAVLAENNYNIVDIRDLASFTNGHIQTATHLSNESIGDFMREADLDKPVVVCCYHGISSIQAAQFLLSQDFTEVYSLDGGFTQWQTEFPTMIER